MKNMRRLVMMSALSGMICLMNMQVYAFPPSQSVVSTRPENSVKSRGRLAQLKRGVLETGRIVLHSAIPLGACVLAGRGLIYFVKAKQYAPNVDIAIALGFPAGIVVSRRIETHIPFLQMSSWGRTAADVGGFALIFVSTVYLEGK